MGAERCTALRLDLSGSAPLESADGAPVQVADVQPIGDARRATALRAAMSATHTTGRALAERLGCDERIVRDILARRRPLTTSRVAALPPRLRAAFERALAAPQSQLSLF